MAHNTARHCSPTADGRSSSRDDRYPRGIRPGRFSRIQLALYGGIGAVAPDIILLYSKRWTMPGLTFHPLQYIIATALYVGLAVLVALVFPYGRRRSPWKAFAIGVGLPAIVAGLASLQKAPTISPRGGMVPGDLWDLLAFF